jgi:hypothetical protein
MSKIETLTNPFTNGNWIDRDRQLCGFDCWLMHPRAEHYPEECMTGTDLTVIPLDPSHLRFAIDHAYSRDETDWMDDPIFFELHVEDDLGRGEWTYLFPVGDLQTLESLEDCLEDLLSLAEEV